LAVALEGIPGIVTDPGLSFRLTTVATLAGGTLFIAWLADQITARGIGNGIALILAVGFFIQVPALAASAADDLGRGLISSDRMLVAGVVAVAITALVAVIEGGRRRIDIDYPRRTISGRTIEGRSSPLLLKINSAGLIPAIIGAWLIYLPTFVLSFTPATGWRSTIFAQLHYGRPLYMALFAAVIFGVTLYYTAFLLDPEKVSEALKRHGGVLRGIVPGEPTADYIDYVLSRVTLIGAVYLAAVYILPQLLVGYFHMPVFMGGASLLVVVCAMLDIEMQVKQQALLQSRGMR
jgi:preprotein translocase subunit SecY